jgi:hypothetical protein
VGRRRRLGDVTLGLEAGGEGGHDVASRGVESLAQRERGGDERDARVAAHRPREVVVVEGVSGRPVREDGVGERGRLPGAEDGRLAVPDGRREGGRPGAGVGDRAGERHADRVDEGALDRVSGGVGDVLVGQPGDERRQFGLGTRRRRIGGP